MSWRIIDIGDISQLPQPIGRASEPSRYCARREMVLSVAQGIFTRQVLVSAGVGRERYSRDSDDKGFDILVAPDTRIGSGLQQKTHVDIEILLPYVVEFMLAPLESHNPH